MNKLMSLCFVGLWACVPAGAEETKYEFKIETIKPQTTVSVHFKVEPDTAKISAGFAEAFGKAYNHVVAATGSPPTHKPFGRYHTMSETEMNVEAGIPVDKKIEGKGEVKASTLPGGKVVTTIHSGPYEGLTHAHAALQVWVKAEGHKPSGGVWESYITDPGAEPDPKKWKTKLFQPIE